MIMEATKQNTIGEILQMDPGTAPLFMGFGMFCIGCPGAQMETLEEAAAAHGIDCDELLGKINELLAEKG